jgi:hypothetical protein
VIEFILQAAALASMVLVPFVPAASAMWQPYEGRHRFGVATGSSAQCGRVLL